MRKCIITERHEKKARLCYPIVRTGSKRHRDGSRWWKEIRWVAVHPSVYALWSWPSLYSRQNSNFSTLLIWHQLKTGLVSSQQMVSALFHMPMEAFPDDCRWSLLLPFLCLFWRMPELKPYQGSELAAFLNRIVFPLFNYQATSKSRCSRRVLLRICVIIDTPSSSILFLFYHLSN